MQINSNSVFLQFFKQESASGIILMLSAVLAIVLANSPLEFYYALFLETPVELRVGAIKIAKPLLLWINDGLMAIFFFVVGLELKREMIEGELSNIQNVVLPGAGAIGGMLIPALVYSYFNYGDVRAMKGWAIPAATDIAFALGILYLLGSRVPISIRIFLTSLAVFDDIGAVIIIAIFYTSHISLLAIIIVACCMIALAIFNRSRIEFKSLYVMIGIVMWVAMLKSGVHATLTGVILAMFIPSRSKTNSNYSMLKDLEGDLHALVAFFILPFFAFANSGITLSGVGIEQLLHDVPLGIALGLFLGKQAGVFGFCWLSVKLKLTALPSDMSWAALYGTAALCGIGFTMSLFIGSLAFEETNVNLFFDERLGIILGSLASGITGYTILRFTLPNHNISSTMTRPPKN